MCPDWLMSAVREKVCEDLASNLRQRLWKNLGICRIGGDQDQDQDRDYKSTWLATGGPGTVVWDEDARTEMMLPGWTGTLSSRIAADRNDLGSESSGRDSVLDTSSTSDSDSSMDLDMTSPRTKRMTNEQQRAKQNDSNRSKNQDHNRDIL